MPTTESKTVLTSPLFILAIATLAINDLYLKSAFPNLITGKLSDFAGLFALPLYIGTLFRQHKRATYILTGAAFIAWKLPAADTVINAINTVLPFTIGRTIDYGDYWALLILPISYFYKPQPLLRDNEFANIGMLTIACFLFCATAGTHGSIKSYNFAISKYQLQSYVDTIFALHPELGIPNGNTFYEKSSDPYFDYLLATSRDTMVYTLRYYGDQEYWNRNPGKSSIFITHVGFYNKPMKTNDDLSSEEKAFFIKRFEQSFITMLSVYCRPYVPLDEND